MRIFVLYVRGPGSFPGHRRQRLGTAGGGIQRFDDRLRGDAAPHRHSAGVRRPALLSRRTAGAARLRRPPAPLRARVRGL